MMSPVSGRTLRRFVKDMVGGRMELTAILMHFGFGGEQPAFGKRRCGKLEEQSTNDEVRLFHRRDRGAFEGRDQQRAYPP
jgi:hypothetical protein